MQRVNFNKINAASILQTYNIKNIKARGDNLTFSCPFSEHARGDRRPSSWISKSTGAYKCWGCGRKGNLITLVAEIEGVDYNTARKKLVKAYDAAYQKGSKLPPPVQIVRKKIIKETILPEDVLDMFRVEWIKKYRGIDPVTLDEFQIGYDEISRRVTIPYRNADGELVGVKARATDPNEETRFIMLGGKNYGFPRFTPQNYIYQLHSAHYHTTPIVVEGEFDVLSLRQRGFPAIGISGSNPSKKQIKMLDKTFDDLILLLDPDEQGRKCQRFLAERLFRTKPNSRIARLKKSDPADSSTQEIEEAIESANRFYI